MTTHVAPRTVGRLMTDDPVVVGLDTPLVEAASIMDFYRISGLPVVDAEGRLAGVISQTDLAPRPDDRGAMVAPGPAWPSDT